MRTNITVAEAQDAILERVESLPHQTVPVGEALGRVLAEEVFSTRTLPPADCSAMDGYALASADTSLASQGSPAALDVAFEVAAGGQASCELAPGRAARIFTGAPVPPGADAVVMQEHTEEVGNSVRISAPVPRGSHIREAGEDLWVGDLVLEAGSEIRAPQIGLLSSLGRSVVAVHRRPRVAILSSGDELVEPDRDVVGGRIVSSNSYTLSALCREVGAEPIYLGIARDRPEELEALVRAGLSADCLVTSAGVSVGDHDHGRGVLEKLGCELVFWGIQMKPGHPMTFGRFERGVAPGSPGPFVFGLPGNPVSAAVTFEQFVRPALRRMSGHRACFRPVIQARLESDLSKKPGRVNFVRVRLERRDGEIWACTTGNQGSGVFRSMSIAQGLLIFSSSATRLAAGSPVPVQVIDDGFFAQEARGFDED
jgi:molybdopterin molybdotransferase